MCGIYGSVERDGCAAERVFSGLKMIEYRGYDSFGIALPNQSGFETVKRTGGLPESSAELLLPKTNLALGHTRWATHGGVTVENAHPHLDCTKRLAVVHNGIVENFEELKTKLGDRHKFSSETDTETIVHLLEEEMSDGKTSLVDALTKVYTQLKGTSTILASDGQEMVAVKSKKSPLAIGKMENGYVVGSDPTALLPYTKEFYFPEKDEIVVLNGSALRPSHPADTQIPFSYHDWKYQPYELGEYTHFMHKEISEQPETLANLLKRPDQITKVAEILKNARNRIFFGCGSAYFASVAGKYLMAEYAGVYPYVEPASELPRFMKSLNSQDVFLAVTQSGETTDILEQVDKARETGAQVTALINAFGSTLYRELDTKVMLESGIERAVLATKSFTHMVSAFLLLATEMGGSPELGQQIIKDSIESIKDILSRQEEIKALADLIKEKDHLYTLGRGISYPVALEAALKIKEGSYIHAEGFAGAELKHGVMALIEEGTPVLAFAPTDDEYEDIVSNTSEVKARGAITIGVGSKENTAFTHFFKVNNVGASSILPNIVFAQLLGFYTALARGVNPDKPRNLAKSVTVK